MWFRRKRSDAPATSGDGHEAHRQSALDQLARLAAGDAARAEAEAAHERDAEIDAAFARLRRDDRPPTP
jgi:hypothetical protein